MKKTALSALLIASLLGACSNSSDNQTAVGTSVATTPPATSLRTVVVAQNGQLVALDADGQNPLVLTKGFQDSDPAFRPDGADLIFSRVTGTGRVSLFRLHADGSATELTPDFPHDVYDADYSFDGQRIVFAARIGPGDYDLYTLNADGTGLTQVTSGPDLDRHPDFSTDGRQIGFQRNHLISLVGAEGGAVTTLTEGSQPTFNSAGQLVFSHQSDLWHVGGDSDPNRLTQTAHIHEFHPAHGTGDMLYTLGAATPGGTTGELYLHDPESGAPQQLTSSLGASHLAVSASRQGGNGNKFTANAPYARSFSPFTHAVGVCYGHFNGRSGNVQSDMDTLTKTDGFKMIHIYNLFQSGGLNFDPDMLAVMDYAVAQSPKLEILLGTLNDEVTGILQSSDGATRYVAALKPYLDAGVIKVIGLGNEPNAKGQANLGPGVWTSAAQNLRTALTAGGYQTPISACLLFGGLTSYPPAAARFQEDNNNHSMLGYMQAINSVNPSNPFVFVNILPSFTVNDVVRDVPVTRPWYPDFGTFRSTTDPGNNDGNVRPYWALADLQYNCVLNALRAANLSKIQVYISESGWPSDNAGEFATPQNEADYINGLLTKWVRPQMQNGGAVPTFLFEAFDEPTQERVNSAWGLRDRNGALKSGLTLPSWISE